MHFHTIEEIVLQHSTRHMDKIQAMFPFEHTKKAAEAFLKFVTESPVAKSIMTKMGQGYISAQ